MREDRIHAAEVERRVPLRHLPVRPLWLCRACGQPWPCGRARLVLLADYQADQVGLFIYLAGLLHEAIDDFHRLDVGKRGNAADLFDRFLGWCARHRASGSRTPGV